MKRVRNSVYSLLFVVSLLATLFTFPATANAASAYDGVVQPVDRIYAQWGDNKSADLTTSWPSVVATLCNPSQVASFQNAVASNGYWLVRQTRDINTAPNYQRVEIEWTDNITVSPLTFLTVGADESLTSPISQGWMVLQMTSSSSPLSCYSAGSSSGQPAASTSRNSDGTYIFQPFFANYPVVYPAGYEGKQMPSMLPSAKYVAMGDSFSSGEGNAPFEPGTDQNGVNECHRSPQAYSRLLQNGLTLGSTAFVACGGATTDNVTGGQWNEPAQLDALSAETEVATITIGGNDVKIREFAEKCVSPLSAIVLDGVCDEYTDIYDEVTGLIANSLPAKLESVYTSILNAAPNAQIYVGGYPRIAPYKYINDPFDQDCGGLYDEFPNTWGDARAVYEVVNLLNAAIEDAVEAVNTRESTTRLHYIDVSGGAFAGHDICESSSYFNGIDVLNPEHSVHPNSSGHVAYADDFEEVMN